MCPHIAVEQALDTGIYIIRSCVYPSHLHGAMLWLTIPNFHARYSGLCFIMYIYACCDTYQFIPSVCSCFHIRSLLT